MQRRTFIAAALALTTVALAVPGAVLAQEKTLR